MTPHDLSEEQIALVRTYAGNVEGLVAAASDESSILHDLFDWSGDDLAAVDNRRQAAEALITAASEPNPAPAAPDGAETETDTAPASEVRSDSVGQPLRGVEIRIGEDPQSPVEPTMSGRIWFKRALALTGYGFPPDVTRPREENGWIATADLGTLNRRGELTVIGRVDDAFKTTSGHLVNPKHIEEALRRCTGVTAAAVVGLPRQNGALIGALVEGVSSPDLAAVRAEVARVLPGWSQPDPVLATHNLPRLANGKIDYRQCAAILNQSTADA